MREALSGFLIYQIITASTNIKETQKIWLHVFCICDTFINKSYLATGLKGMPKCLHAYQRALYCGMHPARIILRPDIIISFKLHMSL